MADDLINHAWEGNATQLRGPEPASPHARSPHCKYADRLSRPWRSRKAAVGVPVDGSDVPLTSLARVTTVGE